MTGSVFPVARAALGGIAPLRRRQIVLRVVVVLVVAVLGLLVRSSGLLHKADPVLPPLDWAAQVAPGVMRAGPATETELMLMRDSFHVRGVIAIGDHTVEELAVTRSLGMRLLTIETDDVEAPTPQQVLDVVRFVRVITEDEHGVVYMHDGDGTGAVLIMAAIVQVSEGVPAADVLGRLSPLERRALSPAQQVCLQDVAAALTGSAPPNNPYAALGGVAR